MEPFLSAVLRNSLPLLFAALGGLFSERGGVIQIALEGLLLLGAFFAAVIAQESGSSVVAFFTAPLIVCVFALLYAYFVLKLKSNQVVAGTALNLLAAGLTSVLCHRFYGSTGATPSLPLETRLKLLPFVACAFVILFTVFIFKKTVFGLWIEFAGEKPRALEASGHSVQKVRLVALLISGLFCGLGGATLSLSLSSSFTRNMTAGRGFVALAALILGNWKPIPTVLACFLFGAAEAVQFQLQGLSFFAGKELPIQLTEALPYGFTLLVLAFWGGKSSAPASLGNPE